MITPNEFWLQLHRLAEAYEAEGLTSEERAENIIAQFQDMPPIAQRALLADLVTVAAKIPELYPLAIATVNQAEAKPKTKVGVA
jgi:hypothetical protein